MMILLLLSSYCVVSIFLTSACFSESSRGVSGFTPTVTPIRVFRGYTGVVDIVWFGFMVVPDCTWMCVISVPGRLRVLLRPPETWAIKIRYCSKHNPCYHGGCAFLLAVWRPFLSIHNAAFCMFFFLCLTHFSLCVILLVSIVCFTRLTHFSDNKKTARPLGRAACASILCANRYTILSNFIQFNGLFCIVPEVVDKSVVRHNFNVIH